jgi:hypothetical protein
MNTMNENPIRRPRPEYVGVADTAKYVRAALAKAFPGQKFSVKSDSYAGGASITVNYVGGPARKAVEAVVAPYCGSDFDGMIDLKYNRYSWLAADGSASRAYDPGTEGSMGVHAEEVGDPHAAGCRYVSFGADYIFVNRTADDADYWAAVDAFERFTGQVVRHSDHEDSERVRTDRKNHRGHWVYRYESRGRKITKLYCFKTKSEDPIPNADDREALIRYMNSFGTGTPTYGMIMERHAMNIQDRPICVAMSELERAERARYGY